MGSSCASGWGVLLAAFTLAVAMIACGGHGSSSSHGGPEPIPECDAYAHKLASCTGRPSNVGEQMAAKATTVADRARLRDVCVQNLQRLNQACR